MFKIYLSLKSYNRGAKFQPQLKSSGQAHYYRGMKLESSENQELNCHLTSCMKTQGTR